MDPDPFPYGERPSGAITKAREAKSWQLWHPSASRDGPLSRRACSRICRGGIVAPWSYHVPLAQEFDLERRQQIQALISSV